MAKAGMALGASCPKLGPDLITSGKAMLNAPPVSNPQPWQPHTMM